MRLTWVQPEDLIGHELVQSAAEGKQVADIADRWGRGGGTLTAPVGGASARPASPELRALASELLDELDARPAGAEATPAHSAEPDVPALPQRDSAQLRDRLHGGWLGRAVGCLLGKPVEKIPREGIREILRATDRWPLNDYFTERGLPEQVAARWPWNRRSRPTSLAENIDGMPEDDDLNYALLALDLMERVGPQFTTDDVAETWLASLPAGRVFTAERAAYRNLLLGIAPPATATTRNPYREWIGAQIRTDVYGWVNPGRPLPAARLAETDARLSHTRNGVFGAAFVAAMTATASVAENVDSVLDAGLSVIPDDCALAEAVGIGRTLGLTHADDIEGGLDELHARYGHLHWVHVVNNAALVAFALQAGAGDFGRSIAIAVTGGWDTDSDGATVGSVVGTLGGVGAIAERWTSPLHNRLATSIPGFDGIGFDELADRTLALVPAGAAVSA